MSDILFENYKKRLSFLAKRRGIKELDLILGAFADSHLDVLSEEELKLFENILILEDNTIFSVLLNSQPVPPDIHNDMWIRIIDFKNTHHI